MKNQRLTQSWIGVFFFFFFISNQASAQFVTIPDPNFRGYLQQNYPTCFNGGGQMDTTCSLITSILTVNVAYKSIADLDGIQYFDALSDLNCSHNSLTTLPVLPSSLLILDCSYNTITTLPALPNLYTLVAEQNAIAALPALPPVLSMLKVAYNQIATLPALPSSLLFLNCGNNLLTGLPSLPSGLVHLTCENNQISSFPPLPNSLYYWFFYNDPVPSSAIPAVLPSSLGRFDASNTLLTVFPDFSNCPNILAISVSGTQVPSIPPLPATLTDFRCGNNLLINTLPVMPPNLQILEFSNSNVSVLPALPNQLNALNCAYNPLTNFPAVLPDSLQSLSCDSANITAISALPSRLYFLSCTQNSGLTCLPLLPPHLEYLTCNYTNVSCIPNMPPSLSTLIPSLPVCNGTSSCALYPEVKGKVFVDTNNNGVQDAGEPPIVQKIVTIQPDDWYAVTDINGNYSIHTEPNISYTQTTAPIMYYTVSPANYNVSFTAMGQIDSLNDFALYPAPNVNDLRVTLSSCVARPGFDMSYWITVENVGTTTLTGDVSLTFDNAILAFLNSSISPSSQVGNVLTWNLTNFVPFSYQDITLHFNVSATTPIGTPLNATVAAQPVTGDATPADNTNIDARLVQGAYDPNEKTVSQPTLTPAEVASGKYLEYIIFFQNTGNDTAFNIKLIDTLSQNLAVNSLEVLSSSHPYSLIISEHGTLHFHFANIQLPDSGTNEVGSHGFVKYRIRPISSLVLGNQIHNKADIYFDYNLPIVTNTATVTIANTTAIEPESATNIKVYPNPATTHIEVEFTDLLSEPVNITLFTPAGQVLNGNYSVLKTAENKREIQLKETPKGVYFLKIETRNGIFTRKIVVM